MNPEKNAAAVNRRSFLQTTSTVVGGALIGSTMVGAMVVHVTVLETGIGGAIIPGALLPLVLAAAWKGRGQRAERALSLR